MLRACILFTLLAVAQTRIQYPGVSAGQCVCATTNVNARSAAGLSASRVTLITRGSCSRLYSGVQTRDGYQWFEMNYDGQRVWAAGNFFNARPDSYCGGSSSSNGRTCHGDIRNLNPTGRSSGGVPASNSAVRTHLPSLDRYESCFQEAADEYCIQASVIAAIASRESGGGSLLDSRGYGDDGRAWGIMQCDIEHSGLNCTECDWNSCCHIKMMIRELLIKFIDQVKAKLPSWTQDQALQGGVAAYNFGVSNVRTWNRLDVGTHRDDYSNDVIARAKWLYARGWN